MRLTDNNGQTTCRFPTGRPITADARLMYVPHQLGNVMTHEFFLDDTNLGQVTLDKAINEYNRRISDEQTMPTEIV